MTASKTPFAGITRIPPGEPLSQDGYAFQDIDRGIIDLLLRLGGVTHKHDAHAALANPSLAATLGKATTGGEIQANLPIYVTYTLQDANGGETLPVATETITTDAGFTDPTDAPGAVVSYAAGTLLASNLSYAITVADGAGGETALGPLVSVAIAPGHANAEVTLSGLAAALAASSGGALGASYRLWRQQDGGPWYLIATGTSDVFVDNGVAGDCTVIPPNTSTTQGTNVLFVTVPTGQPAGTSRFSIYASLDGSFTNPALLGNYPAADLGTEKTYTSLTTLDGAPPAVSSCWPGANQIDADTDIANLRIKSPVATTGDLPTVGNRDGDLRAVLADHTVHIWTGTAWAAVGGGGGGPAAGTVLSGVTSTTISSDASLGLADAGNTVDFTGSTAATVTIPSLGVANFPDGTMIGFDTFDVGVVTFAPGPGITIDSPTGSFSTAGEYGTVILRHRGAGEWVLSGDLAAGGGPAQSVGPALDLAYQAIVLADTPEVWYRLQRTSGTGGAVPPDSSGNGNDATSFTNGFYTPGGPFGPGDGCAHLFTSPIVMPGTVSVDSSAPFVFEAMAKLPSGTGGAHQGLLVIGDVTILLDDGTGKLSFTIGGTTLTAAYPAGTPNNWAILEFVANDADGNMAIWCNGAKLATVAWVAGAGVATGGQIGRGPSFADIQGPFSEVAIYAHALTDARILAHAFGSGLANAHDLYVGAVLADNPAAFYKLERTTGFYTNEPDASGNGHNATSPSGSANSATSYGPFPAQASMNGDGFPLNLPAGLTVDTAGPFCVELMYVPAVSFTAGVVQLGTEVAIEIPDGSTPKKISFIVGTESVTFPIPGGYNFNWALFTFVADDALGELAIWHNGVKVASAAWTTQVGVTAGGMLQKTANGDISFENMTMVSIYQHALSDSRIALREAILGF